MPLLCINMMTCRIIIEPYHISICHVGRGDVFYFDFSIFVCQIADYCHSLIHPYWHVSYLIPMTQMYLTPMTHPPPHWVEGGRQQNTFSVGKLNLATHSQVDSRLLIKHVAIWCNMCLPLFLNYQHCWTQIWYPKCPSLVLQQAVYHKMRFC